MTQYAKGAGPREGEIPGALGLEVSWMPVAFGHQADPDAEEYVIHALADLSDPVKRRVAVEDAKKDYLGEMQKSIEKAKAKDQHVEDDPPTKIPIPNRLEKQIDPDDHLLCFDYLYFTTTHKVCFFHDS